MRLGVSLAVLALLLYLLPWAEVQLAVGRLRGTVWLAVLAAFLIVHTGGAMKWRMLLGAGGSDLTRMQAIGCYGAGLFANLCLPSIVGGDVLRGVLAARITSRGASALWGGLADRSIDILALGILIGLGALATTEALAAGPVRNALLILIVAGAAALLSVALAARRPLATWPRSMRRQAGRSLVALRRLRRRPSTALSALSIALAMQTAFILLNAWIGRSIGIEVPLSVWFVAWPLAKIAGLAPISLGGLGVRDAALGGLLAPLGVAPALGVVASLIWQSVMIVGGLIAGATWWALGRSWRTNGSRRASPPSTRPGSG